MILLYSEDTQYPVVNGDVLRIYECQIQIIRSTIVDGFQLWRHDDGRCFLSITDRTGCGQEDGPYYPVLVRGNLGTGAFTLEAYGVCVFPLPDEAWRPPVLTL